MSKSKNVNLKLRVKVPSNQRLCSIFEPYTIAQAPSWTGNLNTGIHCVEAAAIKHSISSLVHSSCRLEANCAKLPLQNFLKPARQCQLYIVCQCYGCYALPACNDVPMKLLKSIQPVDFPNQKCSPEVQMKGCTQQQFALDLVASTQWLELWWTWVFFLCLVAVADFQDLELASAGWQIDLSNSLPIL